ncbi:hypothetical protein [Demequina aurantiaca]|uniref:hypothetical protein n=1 Tax=Demequina aurantiaca TaxID=676200 RepID=UPI003D35411F
MIKKPMIALGVVAVLITIFAVALVSAVQLLFPRDMPFGITESSPVVEAVQKDYDLDIITYDSESDLKAAAERGDLYGGYIVGTDSDTLITVPAKSFFGEILVVAGFEKAAQSVSQEFTTTAIAPLPLADRTGGMVGLLLLPTLMAGYLIASLLYSATKSATTQRRIAYIVGFSAMIAVTTWVIAAPVLNAIPVSDTLALIPAFFLVALAVGFSAVALQAIFGSAGSLLAALLFIIIGGAGAGGGGIALLPTYWQALGNLFPPRHAVELYRNILYFGGNNIILPIAVLSLYAVLGLAIILVKTRRDTAAAIAASATLDADDSAVTTTAVDADASAPAAADAPAAAPKSGGYDRKVVLVPAVLAFILTGFFALNYTSSGHEPIALNMPFGVVGSSDIIDAAQGPLLSLDVITYSDEQAATDAIDRGEIYGAFISTSSPAELMVVPTLSDIAPLDLANQIKAAATASGETITVKAVTPTALAPKDPYALVLATTLTALLVAGYMSASMLTNTVGSASGRWRGLWLIGFSVVTALMVSSAVTFWLQGIPTNSFLIAWAIMTLIILVVATFTAVLRRVLGPLGVVVTLIVILQFGNPSSGGSNGAAYLTGFWNQVGTYLPPRNDFLLLRNTIYFGGNGTTQPLIVLLSYLVVFGAILFFLDWFKSKEPVITGLTDKDAAGAASVAIPVGPIA